MSKTGVAVKWFILMRLIFIDARPGISRNYFCHFDCGQLHTACVYAPCSLATDTCGVFGRYLPLNSTERNLMVDKHNYLRNSYATGNLTFGNGKATNMMAISYSVEIEFVAQCWSNQCNLREDICNSVKDYLTLGQNLYFHNNVPDPQNAEYLMTAIDVWFNESKYVSADVITKYSKDNKYENFTQMIWSDTMHIGCGRTFVNKGLDEGLLIVCNYGPEGNIEPESVYSTYGDPCSQRPLYTINSKYAGLCGEILNRDNWEAPYDVSASYIAVLSKIFVTSLFSTYSYILVVYM